ncbi:MAG: response regulator [Betaproteobacteria bacterium]|nr:response regulator [Betaproteobacteria bacterium]
MDTRLADESAQAEQPAAVPALLLVDDEPNILAALKRLFRPLGYRVFTADGGAAGLEVMARESVDLVVSDMRMPEMNGAQFLARVREQWPETVRIVLTGYAEIGATIEAINQGRIHRYIAKPWDDAEVLLIVRHALEQQALKRDKARLERLTQAQNEQLKAFNASLEEKVRARTEELRQTMGFLEVAHEQLKRGFVTSIRVFSNLIEMRGGRLAGHSRRVADLARNMARRMNLPEADVQDVFLAALLHDIGKIGLPDHLLEKPFASMTREERLEVMKHPAKGEAALMALEQLKGAARLIRAHHERFDGLGYPDRLTGLSIPLGARILALANDYDEAQTGTLVNRALSEADAVAFIKEGRGKRYDPATVDVFLGIAQGQPQAMPELALHSGQLEPGMALSRDLVSRDGGLLLAKDYLLDALLIGQIRNYETVDGRPLTIYVHARKGG